MLRKGSGLARSGRASRPRVERLTESRPGLIDLNSDAAAALNDLGRRLASSSRFWGDPDDENDTSTDRSVVRCVHRGDHWYEVTVVDAVGLIAAGDLLIEVHPKIDLAHLVHLLIHSDAVPRTASIAASASADTPLWELVARWYVDALEAVLRRGLVLDYRTESDLAPSVRGQLLPTETAHAYYSGRIGIASVYDEFDEDTALNRVLLAASKVITGTPGLEALTRRRARTASARMDHIGPLSPGDMDVTTDRRSQYYSTALALARHVLDGTGRSLISGVVPAQSFLIRTPELVESGIRAILAEALAELLPVIKRGRQLSDSRLTLNPDLVFGNVAIGDVKYRLIGGDWNRRDLYQIVAFATAFGVQRAALIAFGVDVAAPPALRFSNLNVQLFRWMVDREYSPTRAADELSREIRQWLCTSELFP